MSPLADAARRSIRAKLLLSYLLVVAVGALTIALAVFLSTPTLFDRAMRHMAGMPGMMGMGEMTQAARDDVTAAFEEAMFRAVAIATAAATVAAVLTAVVVSRRITAPIRGLAAASARLAAGHYRERVAVPGEDEIGALAASFNRLAAALDQAERQRLQLVGDVAHELRTPLATIQGYMEGLLDDVVAPSRNSGRSCMARRGGCVAWWTTSRSSRAPRRARSRSGRSRSTRATCWSGPRCGCARSSRRPASRSSSRRPRRCPPPSPTPTGRCRCW